MIISSLLHSVLPLSISTWSVGKFEGQLPNIQLIKHNGNTGSRSYGILLPSNSSEVLLLEGVIAFTVAGITLNSNEWTHIALAGTGGSWTFYQNGVQTGSYHGTPIPINTVASKFSVGVNTLGSEPFSGQKDNIRCRKNSFSCKNCIR